MSADLDPRITPYRTDLAAADLRAIVDAPCYAEPVVKEITQDIAEVKFAPDAAACRVTEALFGETFTVYEDKDGWAWGQIETDDYVGYVKSSALGEPTVPKTHKVSALRSYLFSEDDLKSPPLGLLSLGSRLAVQGESEGFARVQGGGYVWRDHIAKASDVVPDYVAVAEQFLGAPYLWGGRSSLGLDCSALVQLSLSAAGGANPGLTDGGLNNGGKNDGDQGASEPPRDSDMQRSLGDYVPWHEQKNEPLQRGDLVLWDGHIGIMTNKDQMLHANAHHMAVAKEPLSQAIARIADKGSEVLGIRRP